MERGEDGYEQADVIWEVAQIEIVFVLPARLGGRFGSLAGVFA